MWRFLLIIDSLNFILKNQIYKSPKGKYNSLQTKINRLCENKQLPLARSESVSPDIILVTSRCLNAPNNPIFKDTVSYNNTLGLIINGILTRALRKPQSYTKKLCTIICNNQIIM